MSASPTQVPSPTVSVIVPVYDVERWLRSCLESVVVQDYDAWDVVVVIDGSPDGSEAIAREYAARDRRFSVVVVDHGGPGAARNIGLAHARGDYIFFLDSDDTIPDGALGALMQVAAVDDVDIVAGVGVDVFPDGRVQTYWTQNTRLHKSGGRGFQIARHPEFLEDHVVWNKVYRRELIERTFPDGVAFPPGVHCEDIVFSAKIAAPARISVITQTVYRHRRHGSAISADYLRERTFDDWIGQAEEALRAVFDLAHDATAAQHLAQFLRSQWWSRAARFHVLSPAQLAALEAFTARLRTLVAEPFADIAGAQCGTFADFFADGGASRRWAGLSFESGPLLPSTDHFERACGAMDLVEKLDPERSVERELATEMVVRHVAGQLAITDPPSAEEFEDLRSRLVRRISTLDVDGLRGRLKTDPGADPEAVVRQYLTEREPVEVDLMEVTGQPSGLRLRGQIKVSRGDAPIKRLDLVMRSQTSDDVVRIPMTWAAEENTAPVGWQVEIPLTAAVLDKEWRIWLAFERSGLAPREMFVNVDRLDLRPVTTWTAGGRRFRAVWIRSPRAHLFLRALTPVRAG